MSTTTIEYLHSSGRFDRSPALVTADLREWMSEFPVDLTTFTEFASNRRLAALDGLSGWSLFNGKERAGADDCVIAWLDSEWTLLKTDVAVVSTMKSYRTNGKLIPPQYVTTVLLLHKLTGNTLQASVSHLPSHVEVSGGLRDSLRSRKWTDATRRWKKQQVALARQWQPSARMMTADWNVNLRARWFRRLLAHRFPALRPVWVAKYPDRGTLGRRIIDIALVNRGLTIVTKARPIGQHKSSDHRAFKAVLGWR